jgi:DUF1009 family protein
MMPPKLGIIAGGGTLPLDIINECKRIERPYFVIALKGHTQLKTVLDTPHFWTRLGASGKAVSILHKQGVTELVMVGSVTRPSLLQIWPDLWTIKFLLRTGVTNKGDDRFLKALINALEEIERFHIVGVHSLLPSLVAFEGVYGDIKPSDDEMLNIEIAWAAALELGRRDIGQAAIARAGKIVAEENAGGTASMIARLSLNTGQSQSGVLVKVSKPGQEKRADLPTIGPDTIKQVSLAGLAGIAIETGSSLVLNKTETIKAANDAGIFILGRSNVDY